MPYSELRQNTGAVTPTAQSGRGHAQTSGPRNEPDYGHRSARGRVAGTNTAGVQRRSARREAHAKLCASLMFLITDDAQLIEAIGHSVVVVPGAPTNFKITTKEDLEHAEAILKAKSAKTSMRRPCWGAKWV